jgi:hypothetical protein
VSPLGGGDGPLERLTRLREPSQILERDAERVERHGVAASALVNRAPVELDRFFRPPQLVVADADVV